LGLVWQLVKIHILNSINLKNHPFLIRLLEKNEELSDLLKLPPEMLLLRWFNYHLTNAGQKKIDNFSGHVKDGNAYTYLLNQIAPKTCDKEGLKSDNAKRAATVLENAAKLGVKCFIKPRDIVSGNQRLNLIFTASIFNTCPGLEALSEEEVKKAGMMEDDVGDSREERVFRLWMNSLGLEDFYVNSLWEDCKDGIAILKVENYVEPGCVQWSKVEMKPSNKFKKLSNCQYAVVIGKSMKFSLTTTEGNDFVVGNRKLLLGFIWQLMRLHTLKVLAKVAEKKFGGKTVSDDLLITWANESIATAKKESKIKSFQDSVMATGVFFLDLIHSLEPKIIDWSLVKEGKDTEEGLSNCKYAVSIARKLGATIFCVPEDLQECKPKMTMTFIAALAVVGK